MYLFIILIKSKLKYKYLNLYYIILTSYEIETKKYNKYYKTINFIDLLPVYWTDINIVYDINFSLQGKPTI